MPYALFTNGEQISKAYRSREEVWKQAEEAGLVVDLPADDEKTKPKQVLDEGYHIEACQPDRNDGNSAADSDREPAPARRRHFSAAR